MIGILISWTLFLVYLHRFKILLLRLWILTKLEKNQLICIKHLHKTYAVFLAYLNLKTQVGHTIFYQQYKKESFFNS